MTKQMQYWGPQFSQTQTYNHNRSIHIGHNSKLRFVVSWTKNSHSQAHFFFRFVQWYGSLIHGQPSNRSHETNGTWISSFLVITWTLWINCSFWTGIKPISIWIRSESLTRRRQFSAQSKPRRHWYHSHSHSHSHSDSSTLSHFWLLLYSLSTLLTLKVPFFWFMSSFKWLKCCS
jgi:hypothetical protein